MSEKMKQVDEKLDAAIPLRVAMPHLSGEDYERLTHDLDVLLQDSPFWIREFHRDRNLVLITPEEIERAHRH